jgi:hypothetical protein
LQTKERKRKLFEHNNGLNVYPTGEARFRNRHCKLYPYVPSIASSLEIHVGLSETEYIMFENEAGIPVDRFNVVANHVRDITYAVSNNSTRYLGNVNGM